MGWHLEWAVVITCVGAGCGPVVGSVDDGGEGGTGTGAGTSSSGSSSSASTSPSTTATTLSTSSPTSGEATTTAEGSDTSSDGGSFLSPTSGVVGVECSTFFPEECPDDHKCMPFDLDGDGVWDEAECFPLDPDPVGIGEPCQAIGGPVSGFDDCDDGSMCFDVDRSGMGTCVPFCDGTHNNPMCEDPEEACTALNDDTLYLCLPWCYPEGPGVCGPGHVCASAGHSFVCLPGRVPASGPGEPCNYANECVDGFTCLAPEFLGACDPGEAAGCCTPFCDPFVPVECPAAAETCQPLDPWIRQPYGVCATVDMDSLSFIDWIAP